jgi:hypothetical protein
MELNVTELLNVEEVARPIEELRELNELQLAMIGGGIGEVVAG